MKTRERVATLAVLLLIVCSSWTIAQVEPIGGAGVRFPLRVNPTVAQGAVSSSSPSGSHSHSLGTLATATDSPSLFIQHRAQIDTGTFWSTHGLQLFSQLETKGGAGSGTVYGVSAQAETLATSGSGLSGVVALHGIGIHRGSLSPSSGVFGVQGYVSGFGSGGTVPVAAALDGTVLNSGGGSTYTTAFGLRLGAAVEASGGVITNAVGVGIANNEAGDKNVNVLAGTQTAPTGDWNIYASTTEPNGFEGPLVAVPQALTIADNGAGTTASSTLTPTSSQVHITCNDANGCDVTMGETSIISGAAVRIFNMSANAVNFADTSGVSEIAGAFAAGQYDSIAFAYVADRWVETSRSNN